MSLAFTLGSITAYSTSTTKLPLIPAVPWTVIVPLLPNPEQPAIDEQGMAKTAERKLEIARRIHDIVTQEYGLQPDALIFDALTFTLATGDEENPDRARRSSTASSSSRARPSSARNPPRSRDAALITRGCAASTSLACGSKNGIALRRALQAQYLGRRLDHSGLWC
mgnify:CR=1 FL=1